MIGDPLRPELRTLAKSLQPLGIPLIIGGGYGILLRSEHIRKSGARTLMPDPPGARSTEDIDVFLKAEVIVDPNKTKLIREVLDQQNYVPIVKNFQFARPINYEGRERSVRIDFLAAPVPDDYRSRVKADDTRIRPQGYKGCTPVSLLKLLP